MWCIVQTSEYDGVVGVFGPYSWHDAVRRAYETLKAKLEPDSCYSYEITTLTLENEDD